MTAGELSNVDAWCVCVSATVHSVVKNAVS